MYSTHSARFFLLMAATHFCVGYGCVNYADNITLDARQQEYHDIWRDVCSRWVSVLPSIQGHMTITLSVSNLAYHKGFANWFSMVNSSTSKGFIMALDQPTCDHLSARNMSGLCFMRHSLSRIALVGFAKIIGPLFFIQNGIDVIFSEMDVFWSRPPLAFIPPEPDVSVQGHLNCINCQLNVGFYHIRSNMRSMRLMCEMVNFTVLRGFREDGTNILAEPGCADQEVFDVFIRRSTGVDLPNEAPASYKRSQFVGVSPSNGVRWARLPILMFTHNEGRRLTFNTCTTTVHISWGVQEPGHRLYCASTLGLMRYDPSYVPQPEYLNSSCFDKECLTGPEVRMECARRLPR